MSNYVPTKCKHDCETCQRVNKLRYALHDIKDSLALWPDKEPTDPYCAKLWREWDDKQAELYKLLGNNNN